MSSIEASHVRRAGLFLLLLCCAALWAPRARADAIVLTATLSGPTTILCGNSATYTLVVTGTGDDPSQPTSLLAWEVLDADGPFDADDSLVIGGSFAAAGGLLQFDESGAWTYTNTFTLTCTSDCTLIGADGSSGESTAEVYVRVLDISVIALEAGRSNQVTVTCTTVPEPATVLLLSTGLAGVAAGVRRRRAGGKHRGA